MYQDVAIECTCRAAGISVGSRRADKIRMEQVENCFVGQIFPPYNPYRFPLKTQSLKISQLK